jgi:hypothetical protein
LIISPLNGKSNMSPADSAAQQTNFQHTSTKITFQFADKFSYIGPKAEVVYIYLFTQRGRVATTPTLAPLILGMLYTRPVSDQQSAETYICRRTHHLEDDIYLQSRAAHNQLRPLHAPTPAND